MKVSPEWLFCGFKGTSLFCLQLVHTAVMRAMEEEWKQRGWRKNGNREGRKSEADTGAPLFSRAKPKSGLVTDIERHIIKACAAKDTGPGCCVHILW